MTREADWLGSEADGAFPDDAQFFAGKQRGHVIVEWTVIIGDTSRRNSPLVVVLESEVIDRWDASNDSERRRIGERVREIIATRLEAYDPNGPVGVSMAFPIMIDEGAL